MRYGRFAHRKAGMLVGINQDDADALLAEDSSQHGTGEPTAENGHIKIVFRFLYDHTLSPQWLMLDQGCPPGETGAVGREHHKIAILNTPGVDRIHVADHHIGFLQMAVV